MALISSNRNFRIPSFFAFAVFFFFNNDFFSNIYLCKINRKTRCQKNSSMGFSVVFISDYSLYISFIRIHVHASHSCIWIRDERILNSTIGFRNNAFWTASGMNTRGNDLYFTAGRFDVETICFRKL